MNWQEKTRRIPRKGDVVKDENGSLGIVTKSEGVLSSRAVWIEDVNGKEIYSGHPQELFDVVDFNLTKKVYAESYRLKGYYVGAYCSPLNADVPLQIVRMEMNVWGARNCVTLRDMRKFDPVYLEVDRLESIIPVKAELSYDAIFSDIDSSLGWCLDVTVNHLAGLGGFNVGSPWSFSTQEAAEQEREALLCRLKARRISSVLNGDWKGEFGWWVVPEHHPLKGHRIRLEKSTYITGAPCYFKNAATAALGSSYLSPMEWFRATSVTRDLPYF